MSFFDAATVTFTQNGVNVDIKAGNSTGALLGSSNFQLGWWSPTGWITESSSSMISLLGQTSWSLAFVDPTNQGAGNEHRLFAFDIKASQASSDYPGSGGTPAAVPLPATAWFMMTAVLGFLAKGAASRLSWHKFGQPLHSTGFRRAGVKADSAEDGRDFPSRFCRIGC